jgi:spore coat polysaccharide biosynthesis protein SpsF (cytidylyltransferase family)
MLVRQLIHHLEQFNPDESICLVDYDKEEDFDVVEVIREKGYNVIRIRSIPTYNFDNVIIH